MNNRCIYGLRLLIKYINSKYPKLYKILLDYKLFPQEAIDIEKCIGTDFGILYPGANPENTINFIASFHAIDLYVYSLCKSFHKKDEFLFGTLYNSLRDAVDPKRKISVEQTGCLQKGDVQNITQLIEQCRIDITKLPSYSVVIGQLKKFIQMYSNFRIYSLFDKDTREKKIETWAERYHDENVGVSKWEMSAASNSTLLILVLFACANDPHLTGEEVDNICSSYFPWICGLQVLLRDFVNASEDLQQGKPNLTYYYKNLKTCEERISVFIERALESCNNLKYPHFHRTIVEGVIAIYLSNPKAFYGMNRLASMSLIKKGGSNANTYYNLCRFLRSSGKL
jgi:tetraprenyl-beta-curcumene synthase